MTNKIQEYFDSVRGKKIAFIGLGRTNLPLIKMFCDAGANVYACDSKSALQLGECAEAAKGYGAILSLGEDYLSSLNVDVVFRTPGMNYNHPELVKMRENGVVVTSEMELFFELCPCKIVAVTGSDGKTTTTTIISELLKKQGYNVHLGGNIGNPLVPEIFDIKKNDFAVVELSSFQLISMKNSPDVSVVTNVTPNHLDVHKDMQEYIDAKKNIVLYQNFENRTVLNLADEISSSFEKYTEAQVFKFSRTQKVTKGTYLENGVICFTDGNVSEEVLDLKDIVIPGLHNVENFMAAICAVKEFVNNDTIRYVARTFQGVAHRAQFVRELEGVRYYNDSIASSPTRTARGMLSLFEQKIILICGGYDKNIPYEPLGPVICSKVKTLILIGKTAPKIEAAVKSSENYAENSPEIYNAKTMEEAVNLAHSLSVSGDIVSLSPASASFDMYKDFEARGNHFMSLVNSL
ncbi:MAG: UDP-N-acetylmuramoyl-L-alanine--D-glutamate ligase [Ruminococcaceae bacterium]|nr:UDP-N-acetylmuramoyl-L-alanine--D-glutamate ligase [Oscillospiraceae bacterium]